MYFEPVEYDAERLDVRYEARSGSSGDAKLYYWVFYPTNRNMDVVRSFGTFGSTKTLSLIAILSAVGIATNYTLLPLPNVKLMDAIVFISGFSLGLKPGLAVAVTTWLVYGSLNPLGFSFPTLVIVTLSECLYAVTGSLLKKTWFANDTQARMLERSVIFAVIGFFTTLTYDLITNAATGWVFYGSPWLGLITMNFPIPLGLIHEVSNALFFLIVVPLLVRVLRHYK
jgi:energy-coupling factor transport system substrate-specific component